MQTIYEWLITFYQDFFYPELEIIPDYMIKWFNYASFIMMIIVILIPFIMIYGVIKLISSMGGGRYE